jgi:hypothetical protein
MLTEIEVVKAVRRFLQRRRFSVSWCALDQRGEDLVALHRSGVTFRVEAKGETSSKFWTARFGKRFDAAQCRAHVANALYTAAATAHRHGGPHDRVAIAFPDTSTHRVYIAQIQPALRKLGIAVFWVDGRRKVRVDGVRRQDRELFELGKVW